MTIVGVDGCRDGRFAIRVEDDFANDPTADVFPSVRSLTSAWGDASLVLIDIPIGLPSAERPRRRLDDEARSLLGGTRARSVFSARGAPPLSVSGLMDRTATRRVPRRTSMNCKWGWPRRRTKSCRRSPRSTSSRPAMLLLGQGSERCIPNSATRDSTGAAR